jgi:hypothetical protein
MEFLSGFNSFIEQHKISLKLSAIFVGELYLARKLKYPVYIYKNDEFLPFIGAGELPSRDKITFLTQNNYREVYVYKEDLQEIKNNLEMALLKITRSLSIGNPIENGTKELKLLSMNLDNLYRNPHDDERLMLQFQSIQNLGKFLLDNKKHQSLLFQNLANEKFHFTVVQPMLSSLLLLSFIQTTHLFHDKEVENLFSASYFKDIGFSMIPVEKYDLKELGQQDKDLFANHADFSFDLLEGRIPISKSYLSIIKNHHFMNDKIKTMASHNHLSNEQEMILGIEGTLVSVFDIFVAMTSNRPYRGGMTHYRALEVIKKVMADDYPQEFKALVIFLKQFFKN